MLLLGFVTLKMDISKAYDKLEWYYIMAVLDKMGFHPQWVGLIMNCISSVKYWISQEGQHLGPIIPSRGIRQGDPISLTFLFCVLRAFLE